MSRIEVITSLPPSREPKYEEFWIAFGAMPEGHHLKIKIGSKFEANCIRRAVQSRLRYNKGEMVCRSAIEDGYLYLSKLTRKSQ